MSTLKIFNTGENNPNFKHGKSHTRIEQIRSQLPPTKVEGLKKP